MKQTVTIATPDQLRPLMLAVYTAAQGIVNAGKAICVTLSDPTRSEAQNRAQWPLLDAFSKQLPWPVNGVMMTITPEDWKDILTGSFRKETGRVSQGVYGGMIFLGMRTSRMNKTVFSEYLDFVHSVAADRGVKLPYIER